MASSPNTGYPNAISNPPNPHPANPHPASQQKTPSLPEKPNFGDVSKKSSLTGSRIPYCIHGGDTPTLILAKFLSLLALGPMSKNRVEEITRIRDHISPPDLATLYSNHTQIYSPSSTFTQADKYPSLTLGISQLSPNESYIVLKDKAYKELRPWQHNWFTDFERSLVIDNVNNALSRLGYLDTHPLRKRITDKASSDDHQNNMSKKQAPALGGGMLVSSRKSNSPLVGPSSLTSPSKRGSTQSPKAMPDAKRKKPVKPEESPLKRGRNDASSSGMSSSDEERQSKRRNVASKRSTSSNNSYTLPSSFNDDGHFDEDNSEDDMKLSSYKRSPKSGSTTALATGRSTGNEKKLQFYTQLAEKFYNRYLEYKNLHDELLEDKRGSTQEKKKKLMKLFEMHNTLSQWKRKLWDYHNESNMTQGIMNLLRHKKSASNSGMSTPALAPLSTKLPSQEWFSRAGSASLPLGHDRYKVRKPDTRMRVLDY